MDEIKKIDLSQVTEEQKQDAAAGMVSLILFAQYGELLLETIKGSSLLDQGRGGAILETCMEISKLLETRGHTSAEVAVVVATFARALAIDLLRE